MRDDADALENDAREIMPDGHRRILWIMAGLGLAGSIAAAIFASLQDGLGVAAGILLAFASYYWLKYSLKKAFESAGEGERPRVSAVRYIGRYFTLGAVIAFIYVTGIVPIVPLLLGMAGFGFAVVVDGIIRMISSFSDQKEI